MRGFEYDVSFALGGKLNFLQGINGVIGKSEFFVVEADESDATFLNFNPSMLVITNIDIDHMSTYEHNTEILKNYFTSLLNKLN